MAVECAHLLATTLSTLEYKHVSGSYTPNTYSCTTPFISKYKPF